MSATGRPAEAGTTLIEALVAIAITSLIALVGFPRLQQALLGLAQRQTVAVVAAHLRQVRAAALWTDQRRALVITADGRGYAASGTISAVPPGVELSSSGGGPITFYGDGSTTGGVIWVTAARHSVPVIVTPVSGAISVGGR